jgi:peptide deformylase
MAKKKTKFHVFDNGIYPIVLYVAINPDMEEVEKRFYQVSKEGYLSEFDTTPKWKQPVSTVYDCCDKKDMRNGALCCIWKKSDFYARFCAHEATHIASLIFERIGCEISGYYGKSQEPFAYLVGWVADCLERVKKNKV